MAKTKIAILGGGMAGLSAAYQLTKTAALRERHDVTVYQLGWRLGGKAASGRDALGRNLEHGLHVWFGCYENTFQMIQEVYAARGEDGWAMPTWRDAVKPQGFTPIGMQNAAGDWSYWPLTWASNDGVPGDGTLMPSLLDMIETFVDWVILYIIRAGEAPETAALGAVGRPPAQRSVVATPAGALAEAKSVLGRLGVLEGNALREDMGRVLGLIGWAHDAHAATVGVGAARGSRHSMSHDILNILLAVVRGVFTDLILEDAPFVSIDDIELSDWFTRHGADPEVVANSSIVRVIYDTLFQYADGDVSRRNLAAGTGMGTVFRLVGTYKGSMMWTVQAGMGEVIVGPVYEHLKKAGVRFEFFHKVTSIEPDLSDPGDLRPPVQTIRFDLQAEPREGDYEPVTLRDGMVLWPSEPHWDQLDNGAAMQAAKVNFESHWCAWPAVRSVELTRGVEFDTVLLAVALGAFKPLNAEDRSFCAPLMAQNPAFADWVNNVGLVPSLGVQLWSDRTTAELGWTGLKPATVSGPEYLNIWADMTQVIRFESWTETPPKSLHYLTGTYATTLYRQSSSDTGAPARALAEITAQTRDWLNQSSIAMWPAARSGDHFDWSVLSTNADVTGEARLTLQFIRANIDPTETTTLSGAGTTKYRPHADESGFANLILAGEGTVLGFTTSFEGAVISGAAASRAICGEPSYIPGYDFLERRPSQGPGQ